MKTNEEIMKTKWRMKTKWTKIENMGKSMKTKLDKSDNWYNSFLFVRS
jgi:hypothetical protein